MKIKSLVSNKFSIILFLGLLFCGSVENIQAASELKYRLLESFPGFYTKGDVMTDLPGLILSLYKFGIWTVGIAGLFMLVVGGFTYMASAGNNATATTAKGIITDALFGIVAALGAYLIIYVINPDLTVMKISFTQVDIKEANRYGGPTGTGNPNILSAGCKNDAMLAKIKAASSGKINPCLTFALLNTESGCTPGAQSPAGACGIAQLLPGTAGVSCDVLKSNVDLSIAKGITYLLSNTGRIRGNISGTGNSFAQAAQDLYAGYNGGAGALATSTSCDGTMINSFGYPYKKWDCTINPGGYAETQIAAPRFLRSYLACNDDANMQTKLR